MKFTHYFYILRLLQIGIPYDEIFKLGKSEANYILAISNVLDERKVE